MELRAYLPTDLPHLLTICLQTGDNGADATGRFRDPSLLGEYYAAPYAAYDANQCLVLADTQGPCGYVVGAADTTSFVRWFNREWLPVLRQRYRGRRVPRDAPDRALLDLIRQAARIPPCAAEYPAHLHIDLLPRAQGQGWGRRMMQAWMQRAYSLGAAGVHLGVSPANLPAIAFYARIGLHRLPEADGAVFFGARLPFAPPGGNVNRR